MGMSLNNQNSEFQNQLINIRRQRLESYLLKCGFVSKLSIKCESYLLKCGFVSNLSIEV